MPGYSNFVGTRENAVPKGLVAPRHRDGEINPLQDFVNVAANFAQNDFLDFGPIGTGDTPLWQLCRLYWSGVYGAGRTFDVGTVDNPTAFATGIDCSAASGANGVPLITRTFNFMGLTVWELAGLTADPLRNSNLRVTLRGGAGPGSASVLALAYSHT
jgi:hypothetical protein